MRVVPHRLIAATQPQSPASMAWLRSKHLLDGALERRFGTSLRHSSLQQTMERKKKVVDQAHCASIGRYSRSSPWPNIQKRSQDAGSPLLIGGESDLAWRSHPGLGCRADVFSVVLTSGSSAELEALLISDELGLAMSPSLATAAANAASADVYLINGLPGPADRGSKYTVTS